MEYLSKGTGVTLGTLGTVGFGLVASQMLANGGLNGCGLFGNNNHELEVLRTENSLLKAENYSDASLTKTYQQTLADNKSLRDEIFAYVTPIAQEVADNRTRVAVLETQVQCEKEKNGLREQIIDGRIAQVAQTAQCGISGCQAAIANLQCAVNSVTQLIVPATSVCPQPMPLHNAWVAPTTSSTTGS